ncbi:MAG: hypothetical protein ABH885_05515 [Candidatus Omnitrophota bacterium]
MRELKVDIASAYLSGIRPFLRALIAFTLLVNSVQADYAYGLSPQSFNTPLTADQEYRNAVEAYVRACVLSALDKGLKQQELTIADFPAGQLAAKRVCVRSLECRAGGKYFITCAVDGRQYETSIVVSVPHDGKPVIEVDVRQAAVAVLPPFFEAARLARELARGGWPYRGPDRDEKMNKLSYGLLSLLTGAHEDRVFDDVRNRIPFDMAAFFWQFGGGTAERLPAGVWSGDANQAGVRAMLVHLCEKNPELAPDVAAVCDAIGNLEYFMRTQGGYSRAETFYGIAHKLAPDNTQYHKDWALALKHCGKRDDARLEIRHLIEANPDNFKLILDEMYMNIGEAITRLNALEGSISAGSVTPEEFLKEEGAVKSFLNDACSVMRDRAARDNFRCMSGAGQAYYEMARMKITRLKYYPELKGKASNMAVNSVEKERRQLVVSVLSDLARSAKLLNDAFRGADVSAVVNEETKRHAKSMFDDIGVKIVSMLENLWYRSGGRQAASPDRLAFAAVCVDTIHGIVRAYPEFSADIKADMSRVKGEVDGWKTLQERGDGIFRRELSECGESDIESEEAGEGFLGSMGEIIASELTGSVFSAEDVQALMEDMVKFYREKLRLDRAGLAIVYSLCAVNRDGERPTQRDVMEFLELAGVTGTNDIDRRCAGIAGYLNLPYMSDVAGAADEDDRRARATPESTSDILDRDRLKATSGQDSRKANLAFRARLETIEKRFAPARAWSKHPVIGYNQYIDRVVEEMVDLRASITAYVDNVGEYIPHMSERDWQSTGTALMKTCNIVHGRLNGLQDMADKRLARIRRTLMEAHDGNVRRLDGLRRMYGPLGIDWVNSQLDMLDNRVDRLRSMAQDSDDEDYLLYDAFCSLEEEIGVSIAGMDSFGKTLRTYRPLFDAIREARSAADDAVRFFGDGRVFRDFGERLDRERDEVFRRAVCGEQVSERHLALSSLLTTRTQYLTSLTTNMREHCLRLGEIHREVYVGSGSEVKNTIRSAGESAEQEIKSVVSEASRGGWGCIAGNICDIDMDEPAEGYIKAGIERLLFRTLDLSFSRQIARMRPIFLRLTDILNRNIPDTVNKDIRDEMNELLSIAESNIRIMNDRQYDSNEAFDGIKDNMQEQLDLMSQKASRLPMAVRARWWSGLSQEVEKFRNLIAAWIDMPRDDTLDMDMVTDYKAAITKLDELIIAMRSSHDTAAMEKLVTLPDEIKELLSVDMGTVFSSAVDRTVAVCSRYERGRMFKQFVDKALEDVHSNSAIQPPFGYVLIGTLTREGAVNGADYVMFSEAPSRWAIQRVHFTFPVDEPGQPICPNKFSFFMFSMMLHYQLLIGSAFDVNALETWTRGGVMFNDVLASRFSEIPVNTAMLIKDALRDIRGEVYRKRKSGEVANAYDVLEGAAAFIEKLENMDRMSSGRLLTEHESSLRGELMENLRIFLTNCTVGLFNRQAVCDFAAKLSELAEQSSGIRCSFTVDDDFRASLLDERDMIAVVTSPVYAYPAVPRYAGVAVDPAGFCFETAGANRDDSANELAAALSDSLRFCEEVLSGPDGGQGGEGHEWHTAYEGIKMKMRARAGDKVAVLVADDLPSNCLIADGRIMFDRAFVEYLLANIRKGGRDRECALLILGERVLHELGLFLRLEESIKTDRSMNETERLITCESDQTEADVVFYRRMSDSAPGLYRDIEEFTDRIVDGAGRKFSRVFMTSHVFRNMKIWAGMLDTDRRRMRSSIGAEVRYVVKTSRLWYAGFNGCSPGITDPAVPEDPVNLCNRIAGEEEHILNSLCRKDSAFSGKKRKIVVSASLMPDCQKRIITQVNAASKEAFESGWSSELIEILPYDAVAQAQSDENFNVVLLLKSEEASMYAGNEQRLAFEVVGNGPVAINGIIAAGRAVLYSEMDRLRNILMLLSGGRSRNIPDASTLQRLLSGNSLAEFARLTLISLSELNVRIDRISDFNDNQLRLIKYA